MRTVIINKSLEISLSRERLEIYLEENNNDIDAALTLHEYNTRLSEAFYTPLQCVEVCFRNILDKHMSDMYGGDWLESQKVPLSPDSRTMINDAFQSFRRDGIEPRHGEVIAELKFGFWVGLLGTHYDNSLWRTCLHRGFLQGGGRPRKEVHGRFNAIRRFRNRVAHHEPIFNRPFTKMHEEIIEAIKWMCRDTAAWASHHSRVLDVVAEVGVDGTNS